MTGPKPPSRVKMAVGKLVDVPPIAIAMSQKAQVVVNVTAKYKARPLRWRVDVAVVTLFLPRGIPDVTGRRRPGPPALVGPCRRRVHGAKRAVPCSLIVIVSAIFINVGNVI
jgi:hypothetical protein